MVGVVVLIVVVGAVLVIAIVVVVVVVVVVVLLVVEVVVVGHPSLWVQRRRSLAPKSDPKHEFEGIRPCNPTNAFYALVLQQFCW